MSLLKQNFIFEAFRYEEWQGGICTSTGQIDTTIILEVYGGRIHVELDNIDELRILKKFSFADDGTAVDLGERIQYVNATSDLNPVVPIVCQLFKKGEDDIDYVRFAMTNPDRLIEFYGTMTELGQEARREKIAAEPERENAERILEELESYGMRDKDAIYERAVKIYKANSQIDTTLAILNIIEALKLFIEAYKLELEKMEEDEDEYSIVLPNELSFIALCNWRIGNINQAYWVAKLGLVELEKTMEMSPIQGFDPNMLGKGTMEQLISEIEDKYEDMIDWNDDVDIIDVTDIDLSAFHQLRQLMREEEGVGGKNERELLMDVIHSLDDAQASAWDQTDDLSKRIQLHQTFELFKNAMYFCWEKLGCGNHWDFWEEGTPMMEYMMFEADPKPRLIALLKVSRKINILPSKRLNETLRSTLEKTIDML